MSEQKNQDRMEEDNLAVMLYGAHRRGVQPLPSFIANAAASTLAQREARAARAAEQAAAAEAKAQEDEAVPVPDLARMTEGEREYIADVRPLGRGRGAHNTVVAALGAYAHVFTPRLFQEYIVTGKASPAMEDYIVRTIRFLGRIPPPPDYEHAYESVHYHVWSLIAYNLILREHEGNNAVRKRVAEEVIRAIPTTYDTFLRRVVNDWDSTLGNPACAIRNTIIQVAMDQQLVNFVSNTNALQMFTVARDALLGHLRRQQFGTVPQELFYEFVDRILWPTLDAIWNKPMAELYEIESALERGCSERGLVLFRGLRVLFMLSTARFTDLMTRREDAAEIMGITNPTNVAAILERIEEGDTNFARFPHVQANVLWLLDHLTPMMREWGELEFANDLVLVAPTAVSDFFVQFWIDHYVGTPMDAIEDWPGRSKFLSDVLKEAFDQIHDDTAMTRIGPLVSKMKAMRLARLREMYPDDEVEKEAIYMPWFPNPVSYTIFRQSGPHTQTLMNLVVVETCKDVDVETAAMIRQRAWLWQGHARQRSELFSSMLLSRLAYVQYMRVNDDTAARQAARQRHGELWDNYNASRRIQAADQMRPRDRRSNPVQWMRPPEEPEYTDDFTPAPFSPDIRSFDDPSPLHSMQEMSEALDEVVRGGPDVHALIMDMYMGHTSEVDPRVKRIRAAHAKQRAAARPAHTSTRSAAAAAATARPREEEKTEDEPTYKRTNPRPAAIPTHTSTRPAAAAAAAARPRDEEEKEDEPKHKRSK